MTNRERAEKARQALRDSNYHGTLCLGDAGDALEAMGDLICDLFHYGQTLGLEYQEIERRAEMHYLEERNEPSER